MKVAAAIGMLLGGNSAHAMGGQPASFWVGGCALVLVGSSLAIVLDRAAPLGKLLALLVIGMGAAAIWGLSSAPEYSTYETWINSATALCTSVSIYGSRLVLKLSRN